MGGNTEGEGELEGPASVDEGVPVAAAATGESEGGCVGGMERVGAPTVALPSALPLLLALLLSLKLYEGGALCEAQLELVVTAVAVRGGEREANAAVGVPPLLTVTGETMLPLTASFPPSTVVGPVYVLLPVRLSVPVPDLVNTPVV